MKQGEKKKSFFPYFWEYKKAIVFYVLFLAAGAGLAFWSSIETANFLNNLAENDVNKAFYTLIAITIIPLAMVFVYYFAQLIYIKTSAKIALNIKKDLAERVLQISSATMEHTSSGVVINRIANDPEHLINSLDGIVSKISDLVICLLTVVYIAILNWVIGLAVFATIIILVVIEIIRAKFVYKYAKKNEKIG